jgi:hypothetical protein
MADDQEGSSTNEIIMGAVFLGVFVPGAYSRESENHMPSLTGLKLRRSNLPRNYGVSLASDV